MYVSLSVCLSVCFFVDICAFCLHTDKQTRRWTDKDKKSIYRKTRRHTYKRACREQTLRKANRQTDRQDSNRQAEQRQRRQPSKQANRLAVTDMLEGRQHGQKAVRKAIDDARE